MTANAKPAETTEPNVVCVLDMGKQKRKRVKKLRKGEGRLMSKVEGAVSQLQSEGVLEAGVQTVVVVVREERSVPSLFGK